MIDSKQNQSNEKRSRKKKQSTVATTTTTAIDIRLLHNGASRSTNSMIAANASDKNSLWEIAIRNKNTHTPGLTTRNISVCVFLISICTWIWLCFALFHANEFSPADFAGECVQPHKRKSQLS